MRIRRVGVRRTWRVWPSESAQAIKQPLQSIAANSRAPISFKCRQCSRKVKGSLWCVIVIQHTHTHMLMNAVAVKLSMLQECRARARVWERFIGSLVWVTAARAQKGRGGFTNAPFRDTQLRRDVRKNQGGGSYSRCSLKTKTADRASHTHSHQALRSRCV